MLRMHIDQLFAQFLHLCQRSGRVINECTAFAGCLHFASQDTFFVVVFQFVLFKNGRMPYAEISKRASIIHLEAPRRIAFTSARCPSSRPIAPRIIDFRLLSHL